jgi:hypothetical protein
VGLEDLYRALRPILLVEDQDVEPEVVAEWHFHFRVVGFAPKLQEGGCAAATTYPLDKRKRSSTRDSIVQHRSYQVLRCPVIPRLSGAARVRSVSEVPHSLRGPPQQQRTPAHEVRTDEALARFRI